MNYTSQIAKHFRDLYFGGNWTAVNMKDTLSDVDWKQATTKIDSFNTLATLVFHTNYYVDILIQVLEGGPLDGNDKLSFDHPAVKSEEDWQKLLQNSWAKAEKLATLIEQLPDEKLLGDFVDPKYGSYYRNINGIIEHSHYHLGQMVILKKLMKKQS
ncbi:DUF1572 domain-containing protein [Pukyongia salina]|uniref:DUF1572 domain-containing protein n=1 Tax=Pukyongia salina TaxID=2094025 RepID=A0A2S0HSM9_9FLAO|nr:DUF1572 domain-containing protein [Pukyongia salina]AVI49645.1 DUF1572 domain-containing protein [Pukyongia salina]